jgi:putative ABC transport system permease protein
MVLAIDFSVAASMTTYAMFRAVSGNPLPEKSAQQDAQFSVLDPALT